jgi:hypothetical protein
MVPVRGIQMVVFQLVREGEGGGGGHKLCDPCAL